MSQRRTSVLGALLVALGPISMALYTPAMPALVEAFGTSEASVKLTLALYFLGFSLAQLVCGPLSDAYGRRRVTLWFLGLYLVSSVLATLAPTIEWLLFSRLLQGVGASVGVAVSRAIVRDQFTGETSSRIMNTIAMMLAAGPAFAPTIGGLTLGLAGWHAIFALMVAFGLAVLGVTIGFMRETTVPDPALIRPGALLRSYRQLLTNLHFMTTSLAIGGSIGAFYTLATVLPFVLIERAGLTPTEFGVGMLAQSGLFFLGSLTVRFAMRRVSAYRLVPIGLSFIATGSALLALSIALLEVSYLSVMGPVGVYAFGTAFVLPAMSTAALAPFPNIAGAASALTGFIQMGSGLVGGVVAAAIGDPVLATQIVVPALAAAAVGSYLLYRARPHLAEPEPKPVAPAPPLAPLRPERRREEE